jgi:hypothetical protein
MPISPDEIPRECGTCHACCQWLGIEAQPIPDQVGFTKYPGHTCKHLNAHPDPLKKCQVYSRRPTACQTYKCAWLNGFLNSDGGRPNDSGLLITTYNNDQDGEGPRLSCTVIVIDPTKCGTVGDPSSSLQQAIDELVMHDFQDIRVVSYVTKSVIHLLRGQIYQGELLPFVKKSPEELSFVTFNPPIGTYGLKKDAPHTIEQDL